MKPWFSVVGTINGERYGHLIHATDIRSAIDQCLIALVIQLQDDLTERYRITRQASTAQVERALDQLERIGFTLDVVKVTNHGVRS